MKWYEAVQEMLKDRTKVFVRPQGNIFTWHMRFNGSYIEQHSGNGDWRLTPLSTRDQQEEWTEVSPWQTVDYAQFMDWYCNPNNIGKDYRVYDKQDGVCLTDTNLHTQPPSYFIKRYTQFRIPKE